MSDGPTTREMTPDEAEEYILSLLRANGPMTTLEIERLAGEEGRRCPDHTVLFLAKMRGRGLIEGEPSVERRGWLWSFPA